MLATIWMCTQEWSLISIRTTAFTFATCHHALHLLVVVDALEQLPQLAVAAHGQVDPHLLDRLRRGEPRLADGLLRDRLVDPLLGLLVEVGHVRTTTLRANLSCSAWFLPSRRGQRWSTIAGILKNARMAAVESQRRNARR